MLDGGQDAKFVVDEDIVIRSVVFFDVVQLQFLVNVWGAGSATSL
jgi:hypothetical protein